MKKIIFVLTLCSMGLMACKQETKKPTTELIPNYKEMQASANEVEKGLGDLHKYQNAVKDILHSFEQDFPKDSFTVKLRMQLSELNKVEYVYKDWQKRYNISFDTLKTNDKGAHAAAGKQEVEEVRNSLLGQVDASKKLLSYLKSKGFKLNYDPMTGTVDSSFYERKERIKALRSGQ